MSHTVTVEVKMTSKTALKTAAAATQSPFCERATVDLYSSTHTGATVQLAEWRYPVIVDEAGTLHYDNYDGDWGDIRHLNRLRQEYSAALVAETMGGEWTIERTEEENGNLVLQLT